jgi:hypothetical protein
VGSGALAKGEHVNGRAQDARESSRLPRATEWPAGPIPPPRPLHRKAILAFLWAHSRPLRAPRRLATVPKHQDLVPNYDPTESRSSVTRLVASA